MPETVNCLKPTSSLKYNLNVDRLMNLEIGQMHLNGCLVSFSYYYKLDRHSKMYIICLVTEILLGNFGFWVKNMSLLMCFGDILTFYVFLK